MSDWLQEIVNQHKRFESPESFWRWSALAAISAVMKDQVWMDMQLYNVYPNIYVMLHADSGMKKGPPVSMAKQLVQAVNNTKIITGRASIQGILKKMGTATSAPGGKIISSSKVFICSSELSSSIVEDKVATKILTDLYDRNYNIGEWESLLKMESFQLKDATVTMLTATNESMSEDFFTKSAISGGYFARTFIIYEKESTVVNSLSFPLRNRPDYKSSSEYLKELSKLKGPFIPMAAFEESDYFKYPKEKFGENVYFSEAGIVYDDWYETFKKMVKEQDVRDTTGTLNRFGDSVLKVAMLLSLAKHPKLELRVDAMHEAIEHCEKLVGNARTVTLGKQGLSNSAILKSMIVMELLNREPHMISRLMLSKKLWMHYTNINELDDIMLSFQSAGIIMTENIGNTIVYKMHDAQVQEYKKFLAGKNK